MFNETDLRFERLQIKDTQLKMGVRGPGTDSRCMDTWRDYWDKGWRFPDFGGMWGCTFVILFIGFSALFVAAWV